MPGPTTPRRHVEFPIMEIKKHITVNTVAALRLERCQVERLLTRRT